MPSDIKNAGFDYCPSVYSVQSDIVDHRCTVCLSVIHTGSLGADALDLMPWIL